MIKEKDLVRMSKAELEEAFLLESYYNYMDFKKSEFIPFEKRNVLFEEVNTIAHTLGFPEEVIFSWDRNYISEMAEACC